MTSPRPRAPLSLHQPVSPTDVLSASEISLFVTDVATYVKDKCHAISDGPIGLDLMIIRGYP